MAFDFINLINGINHLNSTGLIIKADPRSISS